MYIKINPDFISTASEFIKCIQSFGGSFNDWYVGLTKNPRHSFINVHNASMHDNGWILSSPCPSYVLYFVKTFLTSMGCENNIDFDMEDSDRIYLYQMEPVSI